MEFTNAVSFVSLQLSVNRYIESFISFISAAYPENKSLEAVAQEMIYLSREESVAE